MGSNLMGEEGLVKENDGICLSGVVFLENEM